MISIIKQASEWHMNDSQANVPDLLDTLLRQIILFID